MTNRRKLNDFLNSLKGIPPRVVNKKPTISESMLKEEIAEELFVENIHLQKREKKDATYQLWRLLEDIERASERVKDESGYRKIVNELAGKRFLYINSDEILRMEAERVVRKEGEQSGQLGEHGTKDSRTDEGL